MTAEKPAKSTELVPVPHEPTNIYEYVSRLAGRVNRPLLADQLARSGIRAARKSLMDVSMAEHHRIDEALRILTAVSTKIDELEQR